MAFPIRTLPVFRESKIGVPGWFWKNPNALIPLLFLKSSTGCQWPNAFNSAPLFIPSSLWTTSHLTTSPVSSMCASHLLTPSDPPQSLVFMFRRHALLLAIEHFHPLLLVYRTTSLPWSEALPPLPLSKSLLNGIFFPISWFPFSSVFPFPIALCILLVKRRFINALVCMYVCYLPKIASSVGAIYLRLLH